ncbi:MAG: carboxypeptidase regulatory-like domain-containing protein, partial [Planctomycetes bacterium]|nr:carboxypeptidase regulatory-like domain-containing protein [Planctomycetota bacterium]
MFKLTARRQIELVSFLLLTVAYLGCQTGSSDSTGATTPEDAFILGLVVEPPDEADSTGEPEGGDSSSSEGQGAPPVANAGQSLLVFDETLVILNGWGSSDPDGDPLTLTWTQTAGPSVTWSEDSPGIISFLAPDVDEDTHLEFTLSVSDGTFSVDDTVSVEVMNTLTPADAGLPDVQFTLLLLDETDPDAPLDGPRPLIVVCVAATIDGQPIPEGTFTWMFDGVPETGPTDTYAIRTHSFTSACSHTVALALTVSGLTVGCLNTQSLTLEAHPTVWPSISGKVLDASGAGVSSATVSANAGGTTGVTAFDGSYNVHVPCGWSGEITAQHLDHVFQPSSQS